MVENRRPGLGGDFYDAVVQTVDVIRAHPEIGTARRGRLPNRQFRLTRFPYKGVYRVPQTAHPQPPYPTLRQPPCRNAHIAAAMNATAIPIAMRSSVVMIAPTLFFNQIAGRSQRTSAKSAVNGYHGTSFQRTPVRLPTEVWLDIMAVTVVRRGAAHTTAACAGPAIGGGPARRRGRRSTAMGPTGQPG